MKEKSTNGSPFFVAFPSDCLPKATKNVRNKFIYSKYHFLSILSNNYWNVLNLPRIPVYLRMWFVLIPAVAYCSVFMNLFPQLLRNILLQYRKHFP